MDERESRRRGRACKLERLSLPAALLCASSLAAQPRIEHEDVDCLPRNEFSQFLASIQPPSTIRAAKLYFRSSLYADFYFVAMSLDDAGSFQAVLPIPAPETTKIVYYFEAIDFSFQTARSEEIEVSVSGDESCRRGPGAFLYPGTNPAIAVGATQVGAAAIPPGFQATGITGFLTATGAGGGGIGAGVAVGAAVGAAAGVGVIVANGGDSDSASATTTGPPLGGGGTTSIPTATTTTTSSGGASTTTPTTTTPTTTTPTTTIAPTTTAPPSTTTTTEPPSLQACFEWRALGDCKVYFDSCSTPESFIERYEWRMLGPPVPEPRQIDHFTFDFASDPRCGGTRTFIYPVRLTVFDDLGRSDRVQQNVTVLSGPAYRTDDGGSAILSFASRLLTLPPDGSARGQILVNGQPLPPSDNRSATRHEMRVGTGSVRVQLTLMTPAAPGSLWELDFSSSVGLVSGSLRVESGSVAGGDDRRVLVRLNGDRGETIRLRLSLR
jgi:hypothetical protein